MPMQRSVSAAAVIVKLLVYWRHAKWLGDTKNISLLLTLLSPVHSTKKVVLSTGKGGRKKDSLLLIVFPPILSLALYSWFCLICSCHKFLACKAFYLYISTQGMQDVHSAYLLSQSFQRAQPEGLREHCDLHFGDTSCSCYFNCGLVAYSQGKEWILGQKADSFLLSFQSLILDTASNHHIAWKTRYNAQACQPGDKAPGMKINVMHLSMSPFSVHCPSFCLSFISFLFLSFPGNLENFYNNLKLI